MDKKVIVNNGNYSSGATYSDGIAAVAGDVIYLNNLNLVLNTAIASAVTIRNDANAGITAVAGGTTTCTTTQSVWINFIQTQAAALCSANLTGSNILTWTGTISGNGSGSVIVSNGASGSTVVANVIGNTYTGSGVALLVTTGQMIVYGDVSNRRTLQFQASGTLLTVNTDISCIAGATESTMSYAVGASVDKITVNGNIFNSSSIIETITGLAGSNIKVNGSIETLSATALFPFRLLAIRPNTGTVVKLYNYAGTKISLSEDTDPAPVNKVIKGTTYNHGTLQGNYDAPNPSNVFKDTPVGQTVGTMTLEYLATPIVEATTALTDSVNTNIDNLETAQMTFIDNVNTAAIDAITNIQNNINAPTVVIQ